MSNAFVIIKMCYVHNQWYDISCATLYIVNRLCDSNFIFVMMSDIIILYEMSFIFNYDISSILWLSPKNLWNVHKFNFYFYRNMEPVVEVNIPVPWGHVSGK